MESFYFLIPIGLIFVAIALRFLFWAINSGQYDNLDTEAHRILFDEDHPGAHKNQSAGKDRRSSTAPGKDSPAEGKTP